MNSKADRIKRAISDLAKIDVALIFPEDGKQMEQGSEEEALLLELKASVDSLRTSMWCRMRTAETQDPMTQRLVEFHRMRKVTELLRRARQRVSSAKPLLEDGAIERREHVAGNALRNHNNSLSVHSNEGLFN